MTTMCSQAPYASMRKPLLEVKPFIAKGLSNIWPDTLLSDLSNDNSTDDNGSKDNSFHEDDNENIQSILNIKKQKTIIDETKFKTEMCKNWQTKGFCNYGEKCKFAHGKNELNKKDFVNKNLYKSKPCNSFHTLFCCPYGLRCLFIHHNRSQDQIMGKSFYRRKLNSLDFERKICKRLSFFQKNMETNEIEIEDQVEKKDFVKKTENENNFDEIIIEKMWDNIFENETDENFLNIQGELLAQDHFLTLKLLEL